MDQPYIAPPSGGLLGQFAALANSGLQAWDQNRKFQLQQDLANKQTEEGLMSKGLMTDTNPNSPTYKKAIRNPVSEAQYQTQLKESDPTTPESQQQVQLTKSMLAHAGLQDVANQLNEKTSGQQARMYQDQFKPFISGQYQVQARQPGVDLAKQRLELQKGNQAVKAADTFDKDHIMGQLVQQQQQIRRDKHTLDTATTLTPQIFNEINLGIANAISGGKAAAVTTQGKVEYDSLSLRLTNLQQRILNHPEDIGSPEVKKYTADILDRLDNAYSQNMSQNAQRIKGGRESAYKGNAAALDVLNKKAASYSGGLIPQGMVSRPGEQGSPPVQASPETGPHGSVIYQNGHMFQWNPKTKAYE